MLKSVKLISEISFTKSSIKNTTTKNLNTSILRSKAANSFSKRCLSINSAKSISFNNHGTPDQVLKISSSDLPKDLKPNQVLVKMLAAPINPMDFNIVEGTYGQPGDKTSAITFPAVGGNEGVGIVVEVGSGVKGLKVNDRVIPASSGLGTWRTYGVFESKDLQVVPSDIPVEYAATISVNPATAYRLLEDFAQLKSGDVIIQNGANSMVGLAVMQIAKQRGIKTINIIRGDRPDFDSTVEQLKNLGGYIVVSDKYTFSPQFKRLLSDLPAPKLALNCVGGETATEMIRLLGKGGTMVTYGAMSKKPFAVPTSHLLFKELTLKGFWLNNWYKQNNDQAKQGMFTSLYNMIRNNELRLFIEKHNFEEFNQALTKSKKGQSGKKVLLTME